MNVLVNILTLILMLAIYIGIPTLIIVLIIRRKKNPRPRKPRTYRILSPLPIIINIPATFVLTYAEQSDNPLKNEDIWYAVMSIAFVVTIVWAIVECKLAGLWVGPLRWFIGAAGGVLAAAAVIIFLGLCLVIGFAFFNGPKQHFIVRDGETVPLQDYGNRAYLDPKSGEVYYQDSDSSAHDDLGRRYEFH